MYVCGWDGGGTKTEVCVLGDRGAVEAAHSFGPLNINGASRETVKKTVADCVGFMAAQPGGLPAYRGLVIGMAGVSNRQTANVLESALRDAGYAGPLRLLGDQEIALAGAVDGPGAVLIAGTGAICYGRDAQGRAFRTGGYGYLIDDGGSGYAIGRDILSAVARAYDGRDGETCLTALTLQALGVSDIGGVITWLYAPETGKKEVAALAALLLPALAQKDRAALAIAEKAAGDLSELVLALFRKAGLETGELALNGSILLHCPQIRDRVETLVREKLPKVEIGLPKRSAARGAASLAREYFGPAQE